MEMKWCIPGLMLTILITVGGCGDPLVDLFNLDDIPDPIPLNDLFLQSPTMTWTGDSAELNDAAQSAVATFYSEKIGKYILPRWYLNERFFQLGTLTAGDVLKIEPLTENVESVYFYTDDYTLLSNWNREYGTSSGEINIFIPRDLPNAFLRVNLAYLSDKGNPILHITRNTGGSAPVPAVQTVVLNFAGDDSVTFRSGYIFPTSVGAFPGSEEDRSAVIEAFKSAFQEVNAPLNVLTDTDPPPAEPYSTIYIGTISPSIGQNVDGVSEFIDWQNETNDDVCLINVESEWLAYVRTFYPAFYGQAIGRVAAHEMGHLLGLVHVTDPDDIMRTDSKGNVVKVDSFLSRRFKRSSIAEFYLDSDTSDIWTLGYQDTPAYFQQILGPANNP